MEFKKYFDTLFEDRGEKVVIFNPQNGKTKVAPVGFSWTTFFFGPIPALLRGDFLGFILITLIISALGVNSMACGVIWAVIAMFYNYIYIVRKVNGGFVRMPDVSKKLLAKHGYDVHVLLYRW